MTALMSLRTFLLVGLTVPFFMLLASLPRKAKK